MSTFTIYALDAWKIPSLDIRYPILYPSAHTAYMGSMYLTVLLTFERYLAVYWKKQFTIRETIIWMASIFFFVTVYNLPKWMFFKWETNQNGVTELKTTALACDPTFYKVYSAGGYGLFLFILPTLFLITSNVLMHKEVKITLITFDYQEQNIEFHRIYCIDYYKTFYRSFDYTLFTILFYS